MAFNVGDWVRVKDYEDIDWFGFIEDMIEYCGDVYKVKATRKNCFNNNYYELEGCKDESGKHYIFTESCLEKAVGYLSENEVIALFEQFTTITDDKPIIFGNLNKMEDKEMSKQKTKAAERTRIKDKMAEYIYKSGIRSINVIVPNQVVEVEFTYGDKIKTVCNKDDTFSLERAVYIAMAKERFGHIYTPDGIEKKATELTYEKDYVYRVKNALKVYECQQKLAALDKEEEEIKLRQKQKRHERNERRRVRRAEEAAKKEEERRNEQIAIQKEAYFWAMMAFEEEKKKLESKKEEEKQTESTKEIVEKVEKLISDAENTTEDTKENKEPEKANVVGENNKEESSENNVKEETTNKMKETESKVE